ncbi:MAG: putative cysteine desulfurase [Planctomycetota bacterium]
MMVSDMSSAGTMWPLEAIRRQFSGLARVQNGVPVAVFDGPAGSQVPECVVDAVCQYLRRTNCNRGAAFATARESDRILTEAHQCVADFLGADDPDCVIFGPNMTSLTLQLSRALGRTWKPGDEIIVTRLDHDANVTPWVLAARDAGVVVHHVDLHPEDWTLDCEDYARKLSDRTRLVALGMASNATGTINPVQKMVRMAHDAGALTFVDAVHYAPHGRIQVNELQCDFLACSAYKFFGPHEGILWGRRALLESIRPYKLRPSPEVLPGLWMTGTQSHEAIAGTAAAVEYLASLSALLPGGVATATATRSEKLDVVFAELRDYERSLTEVMLSGLQTVPGIRIHGIQAPDRLDERVPTFSWTFADCTPRQAAEFLAEQGVYVWNGNHYALPFTEAAGLEPGGTIRAGALHYNSVEEIQRLVRGLRKMRGADF